MPEIYTLRLTKAMLAAMPVTERRLLLLLGHATNEVNVFNKLLDASVQTGDADKDSTSISSLTHSSQVFIILLDLVGKLHESRLLYEKEFCRTRL